MGEAVLEDDARLQALQRFGGSLPGWQRDIFPGDMLFALSAEARADLMLAIDVEPLAAWVSLLGPGLRSRLLGDVPDVLRLSIQAASVFPSRAAQLALATQGRRALSRGFLRQLGRAGLSFEAAVVPEATA